VRARRESDDDITVRQVCVRERPALALSPNEVVVVYLPRLLSREVESALARMLVTLLSSARRPL